MNELRSMHLFAGIGGGLLADLILGHKPIVAVEWDKYACQVLRERAADGWFPDLSVWEGDVRLFDPSEYAGRVDCIHAGFPCQDISNAGKQAGLGEGTRSGLYREVLRIAGVVRPEFIFLENVSAILSNGLGTVLGDLAAMGYDAQWLCIRASDVGAPHGRDRWFALAYLRGEGIHKRGRLEHSGKNMRDVRGNECNGIPGSTYQEKTNMGNTEHDGQSAKPQLRSYETTSHEWRQEEPEQTRELEGADRPADVSSIRRSEDGSEYEDVADTSHTRLQGREITGNNGENRTKSRNEQSAGCGTGIEWFEIEPKLGRVANDVPNRVGQLKGYGNAQVPLQAATAFRLLYERLEHV